MEEATRAVMHLAEARAEGGVTQEDLARAMGVTQGHISQIEHRSDLYLSTINSYVRALGGELHLCAVFPDRRAVDLAVLPHDEPAMPADASKR
jgi:transcriptional regulator with XRE-family HTH domain